MSGAEVAHRLARKMRLLSQKFTSHEMPPRDESARDLRFLPPFIAVTPEHLRAAADRVLAGKYSFFDLADCELGDPPQWNRDPLTRRGRHAARQRHRLSRRARSRKHQVPVGAEPAPAPAAAGAGACAHGRCALRAGHPDANRFLDRAVPGRLGAQLGEPAGARDSADQLEHHLAVAGRHARETVHDPEGAAFRERWLTSIYQHVRMIAGNLSRFSSANNHLIGEAAGVYVAASTWPLWPQMAEWGERCRPSSKRSATAECTRRWQSRTGIRLPDLRAGLPAARRARGARPGEDFSPVYWRRIEVMIDFLASMTNVAGNASHDR